MIEFTKHWHRQFMLNKMRFVYSLGGLTDPVADQVSGYTFTAVLSLVWSTCIYLEVSCLSGIFSNSVV